MNAAHMHLILNHFPIAGMLFAIPILLIAWWRKNELLGRVGMFVVVLTGLVSAAVFLTGEPAEEIIENLPGVSEKLIEVHEEAAEKAIWFVAAASLAALASLIYAIRRRSFPMKSIPLVTILVLCSLGFLAWTNNLGGDIRHPEIKNENSQPTQAVGGASEHE